MMCHKFIGRWVGYTLSSLDSLISALMPYHLSRLFESKSRVVLELLDMRVI